MIKKTLLILILALLYSGAASADIKTSFETGNSFYESGDYRKAIKEYENALSEGDESGELYYNLGNAYFKIGDAGEAILNYMRARLYLPRDEDLKANIRFTKTQIKSKLLKKAGVWSWTPLRVLSENFTVNELTILASCVFVVSLGLILIAVYGPFAKNKVIIAIVLCLVFVVTSSLSVVHKADLNSKEAVILKPDVEARFGPFESAVKFFVLQEGMVVMVQKTKGDWCKVRRVDGKVGWVKRDEIEKVVL